MICILDFMGESRLLQVLLILWDAARECSRYDKEHWDELYGLLLRLEDQNAMLRSTIRELLDSDVSAGSSLRQEAARTPTRAYPRSVLRDELSKSQSKDSDRMAAYHTQRSDSSHFKNLNDLPIGLDDGYDVSDESAADEIDFEIDLDDL